MDCRLVQLREGGQALYGDEGNERSKTVLLESAQTARKIAEIVAKEAAATKAARMAAREAAADAAMEALLAEEEQQQEAAAAKLGLKGEVKKVKKKGQK